jgi:hypothetical protein
VTTSAEFEKVANMAISITSNPADWATGEKIVWSAVGAALDYDLSIRQRHLDKLNDVISSIDGILGITTEPDESTRLSFNAEIVLRRLQGERIRMDTDRHIEGITELAQKGIIQYNKKSKKWRVKK